MSSVKEVLIGRKEIFFYVLVAEDRLLRYNEVILRARGKLIVKAIDVLEILKRKYSVSYTIETDSENIKISDDKEKRISNITITIKLVK